MSFYDPFELEDEPEVFAEVVVRMVWRLVVNHGLLIVFVYCCFSLGGVLFRKIYLEGLFSSWKVWHQYYEILSQMNERLEANYDVELWENAEFCRNYIKFFESFRRFRARCDRDHKGVSITGNWRKATEAEPLQEFFDADYILHDRLVYAVKGAERIPRENGEEANGEEKEENKERKEANREEKEENKEGKEADGEDKEEEKKGKEANGEEKETGGNEANGEEK